MEEVAYSDAQNNSLQSESDQLKNVIEQYIEHNKALEQTLNEVIKANISLKAGCALLEKKIAKLNESLKVKDDEITALQQAVSDKPCHHTDAA